MCGFAVEQPADLITCFLYSIHYSAELQRLQACIASVHAALAPGGLFCFNAVDKRRIDNASFVSHTARHTDGLFTFSSGWHYPGTGAQQWLKLRIEKTISNESQVWHDEHRMVAVSFAELSELLERYFEVHVLEHDYEKIVPWDQASGNAIFVCVKA